MNSHSFALALNYYKLALDDYKDLDKLSAAKFDIAKIYLNMSDCQHELGSYEDALKYYKLFKAKFGNNSNIEKLAITKDYCNNILFQLFCLTALSNNDIKARESLAQIHNEYGDLDFKSGKFFILLNSFLNKYYLNNKYLFFLNCLKVFFHYDPELNFSSTYLTKFTNDEFTNPFELQAGIYKTLFKEIIKNNKLDAALSVEYASFLIANSRDSLKAPADFDEVNEICHYLSECTALTSNAMLTMNSSILAKIGVNVKKACFKEDLSISPLALKYYLLVKYPQYNNSGESITYVKGYFEQIVDNSDNPLTKLLLKTCINAYSLQSNNLCGSSDDHDFGAEDHFEIPLSKY